MGVSDRGNGRPAGRDPPVRRGQILELEIKGLTHDADGVGPAGGLAVFVPRALPGEVVRVRVTEVRKNHARARLLEVTRPSPRRLEPPCPVYAECGGCQLQHLNARGQLEYKTGLVTDALRRLGGLDGVVVRPAIGMEDPWRYRNKAQFPVAAGPGGRGLVGGIYARGTHRLVPVNECLIQHPLNNTMLQVALELAGRHRIAPYDEDGHTGVLRHVLARATRATGEAMAVFVTRTRDLPAARDLARELMARVPQVVCVAHNTNPRRTNVILGERTRLVLGRPYVEEVLGGLRFRISPTSFFQVNPAQTEVLYSRAVDYAALGGGETVVELYSGIGAISLFLARRAARVTGVEVVPEAVRDAVANARLNGVANVSFIEGPAERVLPELAAGGVRAEVVVLDPPRRGCEPRVLEAVGRLRPDRVVYVSCNPATLARDLARLAGLGYRVREVQPVDMFPQTAHVEAVALAVREEGHRR